MKIIYTYNTATSPVSYYRIIISKLTNLLEYSMYTYSTYMYNISFEFLSVYISYILCLVYICMIVCNNDNKIEYCVCLNKCVHSSVYICEIVFFYDYGTILCCSASDTDVTVYMLTTPPHPKAWSSLYQLQRPKNRLGPLLPCYLLCL